MQCGKLAVPLDYGKPDGETLDLALIRIPATGPRPAHRLPGVQLRRARRVGRRHDWRRRPRRSARSARATTW
ncbi:hypothetical protein [Nonomuraea dietziae]|uniref:hypothetical protein n=1 Tax=Nonomuraea dietziae TaxID=65515 RepID=UPI0031D9715B